MSSTLNGDNSQDQNPELVLIVSLWAGIASFLLLAVLVYFCLFRQNSSGTDDEIEVFASPNNKKYRTLDKEEKNNELCLTCTQSCLVGNGTGCGMQSLCVACSEVNMNCPFCDAPFVFENPVECPCGVTIDVYKMALFGQSSYFPKVERLFLRCLRTPPGERDHLVKVIELLCGASVVSEFAKNGWDIMPSISLLLNSVLFGTLELKFHDRSSDINSCALYGIVVNGIRKQIEKPEQKIPLGLTLEKPYLIPKIAVTSADMTLRRFPISSFTVKFTLTHSKLIWQIVKHIMEGNISEYEWQAITDESFAAMTATGWNIIKPIESLRKNRVGCTLETLTSGLDSNSAAVIEVILIMLKRREYMGTWRAFFFGPPLDDIYARGTFSVPRSTCSIMNNFIATLFCYCCSPALSTQLEMVPLNGSSITSNAGTDEEVGGGSLGSWGEIKEEVSEGGSEGQPVSLVEQMRQVKKKREKQVAFTDSGVQMPSNESISGLLKKYNTIYKEIFTGIWMRFKFGNEESYRTRFVWIDDKEKTFYWFNTEELDKSKAKAVHLVKDVVSNGITCKQTQWTIISKSGKKEDNILLTVVSSPNHSDNVAIAAAWTAVAQKINSGG